MPDWSSQSDRSIKTKSECMALGTGTGLLHLLDEAGGAGKMARRLLASVAVHREMK